MHIPHPTRRCRPVVPTTTEERRLVDVIADSAVACGHGWGTIYETVTPAGRHRCWFHSRRTGGSVNARAATSRLDALVRLQTAVCSTPPPR